MGVLPVSYLFSTRITPVLLFWKKCNSGGREAWALSPPPSVSPKFPKYLRMKQVTWWCNRLVLFDALHRCHLTGLFSDGFFHMARGCFLIGVLPLTFKKMLCLHWCFNTGDQHTEASGSLEDWDPMLHTDCRHKIEHRCFISCHLNVYTLQAKPWGAFLGKSLLPTNGFEAQRIKSHI